MLKLIPLFTMTAAVGEIWLTRKMPVGTRQIYDLAGGTVEGERVNGRLLSNGGDYLLVDEAGVGHVDARLVIHTHDDAFIYMQYYGKVVLNEKTSQAFRSSGSTNFGDTHFVTQPRFEAGDPRYAWLNQVVAVAEGRVAPGRRIQYNVYSCESA
jgi:feruloyl esterase